MQLAAPERRNPTENLYATGNRDHHAGSSEETLAHLRNRRGEHVMDPKTKADEPGRDQRQHEREMAEDFAPRERDDDWRDESKRRNENDVDLRMAEEPEEMLIKNRGATF